MTDAVSRHAIDLAAHLRARYDDAWGVLAGIPAVRGLGVGLVGDQRDANREIGWRVYVDPHGDRRSVPDRVAGFRTLVLSASPSALCYGNDHQDVLKPGIEIASKGLGGGSLGCFARLKSDPTKIVLISNSHVLYADAADLHGPSDDNAVGQPGVSCCWCCKCRVIGKTLKNAFYFVTVHVTNPPSNPETASEIDAAMALVNGKRPYTNDSGSQFYGMITGTPATGLGVSGGDRVEMVGSASGHTKGTVLQFKTTAVYVRGDSGPVPNLLYPFKDSGGNPIDDSFAGAQPTINQMLVVPDADPADPKRKMAFARLGDSGSVVVNAARQVIGLLTATVTVTPDVIDTLLRNATTPLPPHAGVLGSVCPIGRVLQALDIEIVANMAGTAHSSGDELAVPEEDLIREREAELALERTLQAVTRELRARALGRRILDAVARHRVEVMRLLDRKTEVTIAWHRVQGPAFAAHAANSFRDHDYAIPSDVRGVTPERLITRMAGVLRKHGSDDLRADIDRYEPMALDWIADATSVWTLVERLRRIEIDQPSAIDPEAMHVG